MNKYLMKTQSILVYAIEIISIALFVLYLGFMTQYYVLFFDGTLEMFEYYKQLQIFNKEAFNVAIQFVLFALALLVFGLHKTRPGLFGLILVLATTISSSISSFSLISVIPIYRRNYLNLDFAELDEYVPSTFAFDAGMVLHSVLIVALIALTIVALMTFVQRLKEGNPLVRRLI